MTYRVFRCAGALLAILAGCQTIRPSAAQDGSVAVQWVNAGSFAVHVEGAAGSTEEQAGALALNRACEVTRGRGFGFFGVNAFQSSVGTQEVQTQRGGTTYYGGPDGRPVRAVPTADQYETVRFGRALLEATMMHEGSVELLGGSMEIVEVARCTVYSRPD